MRKGYLIGAILSLGCSITCIAGTVVEVVRGDSRMASVDFWGAVAFHAGAALLGLFLLDRFRAAKTIPATETRK